METTSLQSYLLHLADNGLILGHRLSEWCGHGPQLEQDIALSNIALDLIGQARMWYQACADRMGHEVTEDTLAYRRTILQYKNLLLCELPNEDFGYTIVRQFLFDSYHQVLLGRLSDASTVDDHAGDRQMLRAIAVKSHKEVQYHQRWSSEWLIRLGDGTEVSHNRVQKAIDAYWIYADESYYAAAYEIELAELGLIPDPASLRDEVDTYRQQIMQRATLTIPEVAHMQQGGKTGRHTEHMGFILSDLQYMQRVYPDAQW